MDEAAPSVAAPQARESQGARLAGGGQAVLGTMKPYLEWGGVQIFHGDALTVLQQLPSESVHCCVTSPPYWGLRDYGTATWEGGDAGCDHLGEPFRTKAKLNENWGDGF